MEIRKMQGNLSPKSLPASMNAFSKQWICNLLIISLMSISDASASMISSASSKGGECTKPTENNGLLEWTSADGERRSIDSPRMNFAALEAHITERGASTYIVRESVGKYVHSTIVPLTCKNGDLSFDTIIKEGKDDALSSKLGGEIHSGSEYELDNPVPLTSFSWDTIDEILENRSQIKKKLPDAQPIKIGRIYTTPVSVYGRDGERRLVRHLLNPRGSSFSDTSSACYSGCRPHDPHDMRLLRGSMMGREVVLSLVVTDNKVDGTYRFEDGGSDRYLRGHVSGQRVHLVDCEDAGCTRKLGSIEARTAGNVWIGSWQDIKNNEEKCPFVSMPDRLL